MFFENKIIEEIRTLSKKYENDLRDLLIKATKAKAKNTRDLTRHVVKEVEKIAMEVNRDFSVNSEYKEKGK